MLDEHGRTQRDGGAKPNAERWEDVIEVAETAEGSLIRRIWGNGCVGTNETTTRQLCRARPTRS